MSREQNERAKLINQVRDLLSPYLDGEVTSDERELVESMLSESSALQTELDSLRGTVKLVREMPRASAPRPFTLTAADVGLESPPQKKEFIFAAWFKPLVGAMAALAAVIIVGFFVFTLTTNNRATQSESIAFEPVMQEMAKEVVPAEALAEDAVQPQAFAVEEPAAEEAPIAPMEMSKAEAEEVVIEEAEVELEMEKPAEAEFTLEEADAMDAPEAAPMMSAVAPDVAMQEAPLREEGELEGARGGGLEGESGEALMGAAAPPPAPEALEEAGDAVFGAANAASEAAPGALAEEPVMEKSAETVEEEAADGASLETEIDEAAAVPTPPLEATVLPAQIAPVEEEVAVEAPAQEKIEAPAADEMQSAADEEMEVSSPTPIAASEPAPEAQTPTRVIVLAVIIGLLVLGSVGVAAFALSRR